MFDVARAADAHTPPDALAGMASDARWQVRAAAAANRATPAATLAALFSDACREVRTGVAGNVGTLPDRLARLAGDAYASVRAEALANPATPVDVVVQGLRNSQRAMRYAAATNPNLDRQLLTKLASPRTGLGRRRDLYVRAGAAANVACPVDVLVRLAGCDDGKVRAAAAHNRSLPANLLAVLAGDDKWEVREAVAGNPNTPPDVLVRLAADRYERVREAVACNVCCPARVLAQLSNRNTPPAGTLVRAAAAGNANVPAAVLAELVRDGERVVCGQAQRNVAGRLATPAVLRPPDTAVLAQAWLALPDVDHEPDLRIAAVCALDDPGVRTGHMLAYGSGWQAELDGFRRRYGDIYLQVCAAPGRDVQAHRRAPRPVRPVRHELASR